MDGVRHYNLKGEDITPMCQMGSALNLDDGHGDCLMREECPEYHKDCFALRNYEGYSVELEYKGSNFTVVIPGGSRVSCDETLEKFKEMGCSVGSVEPIMRN